MQEQRYDVVKEFYDNNPQLEWDRLEEHFVEFELTRRFLDRYIQPGDRVLDIGGGPGRYTIHLAERGCAVTLLDLSSGNIAFARNKAAERGVSIGAICGNALEADRLAGCPAGEKPLYDHVLLMGPLYHLQQPADRARAVEAALRCLKPGGKLFASFISIYAGIHFALMDLPEAILDPIEADYLQAVQDNAVFVGHGFTDVAFLPREDCLRLMEPFPLRKLHFLTQEGIISRAERNLRGQPEEVKSAWFDFAERLCEREELLSIGEHYLYIGEA